MFVHGPTRAHQDVIGLLKTSGDDGAIESRVGSRERSVFISVPQGLKVGGEFTLNSVEKLGGPDQGGPD